jgi:hypothetical protein
MNTTLESVAGDIETVMREHWNRAPARFHVPLPELITEQEIFETIDCGLLSWPYFSILQDGVPQPPNETTTTRRILLKVKIDGYVHKSNAVNQFHHGSAIRFNQADDWHPRIRPFVQQLRSAFDAELHASVVLSPSGYAERLAGTEPAHVLVLQLEGEAEWTLARPSPDEPDAPARIDIAPAWRPSGCRYGPVTGSTSPTAGHIASTSATAATHCMSSSRSRSRPYRTS